MLLPLMATADHAAAAGEAVWPHVLVAYTSAIPSRPARPALCGTPALHTPPGPTSAAPRLQADYAALMHYDVPLTSDLGSGAGGRCGTDDISPTGPQRAASKPTHSAALVVSRGSSKTNGVVRGAGLAPARRHSRSYP